MKELILFPAQERNERLVTVRNDQVVTSSLRVAEYFGKRHADVLRQVNNLILANAKLRSLYVSSTYVDEQRKERVMFIMNRDGFTLLAMGFTGKKALDFKIAYIEAFNKMEKLLNEQKSTQYAEKQLREHLERFNRNMEQIKRDHKYMAYDCLYPHIYNLDGETFENNLRNIFAQVNNAYISGMEVAGKFFRTENELRELKKRIARFSHEMEMKLNGLI